MRVRTLLLALVALLAGLLLTGCAGGSSTESGEATMAEPAAEPAAVVPSDRQIIRNADIALRVEDVQAGVSSAEGIAEAAGGLVATQSITAEGEATYASLTLRVPAERLDAVLDSLSRLGDVTSVNVSAEDVTSQAVDLDARIAALQTSVTRLQELLSQATSAADLVQIEAELSTRQAELDSLVAQRAALADAVALSTVYVSLSPDSSVPAWTPPGFVSGLQSGWSALQSLTGLAITVAGFAMPFLIVAAVIAVPIVLVILWRRRVRKPRA